MRNKIINKSIKIYTTAYAKINASMSSVSVGKIITTLNSLSIDENTNTNIKTPPGSPHRPKICPGAPKTNKKQENIRNWESPPLVQTRLFGQLQQYYE